MAAATIDEYLANVSDASQRAALEKLRAQIRRAAPEAEECISYGQPAFRQGRVVCGFGATKRHCAFYMFAGDALDAFADELAGFDTSKGTVRFTPDKALPPPLVARLVKARVAAATAPAKKATKQR